MLNALLRMSVLAVALVPVAGCPYITEATEPGAIVETSQGAFTIMLEPEAAPLTVTTFAEFVEDGYYEQTLFHEVLAGSLVRGGGYELGLVQKETRDPIVNESDNGRLNLRGTIAMARTSDPNSATAQFYFNLQDNANLDPDGENVGYAVFGDVAEGFDVVEQIAQVPTGTRNDLSDVPQEDIVISAVERIGEVDGKTRVRIRTTLGDIVVALDAAAAPVTVANFLEYVDAGFYAGTLFHRVVPGFVVQGGGFTLGPVAKTPPRTIANESAGGLSNTRGTVALYFAQDPNEVTPEFFVNLADNTDFDATDDALGYPVFGRVVEGLEVVEQIAALATTTLGGLSNVPVTDVLIEKITLTDIPTGDLELTDAGEAYVNNANYETRVLIRDLLSNLIFFGVTAGS